MDRDMFHYPTLLQTPMSSLAWDSEPEQWLCEGIQQKIPSQQCLSMPGLAVFPWKKGRLQVILYGDSTRQDGAFTPRLKIGSSTLSAAQEPEFCVMIRVLIQPRQMATELVNDI